MDHLAVPDVHCLGARVELDGGLPLLLEGVGAGVLETAKGRLEREAGGGLVDLHHTGLDTVGKGKGLLQVVGDDAGRETKTDVVGRPQGVIEIAGADDADYRPKDLLLRDAHAWLDPVKDRWLDEMAL